MQIGAERQGFNLSYIRGLWHLFFLLPLKFSLRVALVCIQLKTQDIPHLQVVSSSYLYKDKARKKSI